MFSIKVEATFSSAHNLKGYRGKCEGLDHTYLNRIPYFSRVNPTSENIARYIFDQLRSRKVKVSAVTVWENATSAATYEG
jgi:6-pyruvoyltetrahydropterin/6-carboxytetrahydropterin synthase